MDTSKISTSPLAVSARMLVRAWFADGGRWEGGLPSPQVFERYREWKRGAEAKYRYATISDRSIGRALVELGGQRKRSSDSNVYSVSGLNTSVFEAEDAATF
ncbi:hypothetical protein [Glutamicibacter arilaitensis]|uniref:hypothetical protein n=1 Tax=Glutamicibacter arilaitensis TaxID=256701 RepID=UPI0038501DA5